MKTFSLGIITQDFLRSRLKFHYPICLKFHFLKTKSTSTQECKDSKHFSFNLYLKPQTAYYILCNTTYVARLSESFKNLHSTSPPIPPVMHFAILQRYSSQNPGEECIQLPNCHRQCIVILQFIMNRTC